MRDVKFKGVVIPYDEYLKSDEWQRLRKELLAVHNYECEVCGIKNVTLNAHHTHYHADMIKDSIENLELLCDECHKNIHQKRTNPCPICWLDVGKNKIKEHILSKHSKDEVSKLLDTIIYYMEQETITTQWVSG